MEALEYPNYLCIEVSTFCNLRCHFCRPEGSSHSPKFMPMLFFRDCCRLVSKDCIVDLYGNGEPLLHPNYIEMVDILTKKGAIVRTSTNGIILNKYMAVELRDAGMKTIVFSISGGTPEVYEKIQKGAKWSVVWQNLSDCVKVIEDTKALFVMIRSNISTLPQWIVKVNEAGIKKVILMKGSFPSSHSWYIENEDILSPEGLGKRKELIGSALELAKKYGITIEKRYPTEVFE